MILFLAVILFKLFVLVFFAAEVCFLDFGTKSESKPPFDPNITDDEQNLFVSRFNTFSFYEIPQFMYGHRNFQSRSIKMQFLHQSRCHIDVTKDINKRRFKYEVKYNKTVIKTFYDLSDVSDYCCNLNISYKDNPDLVIKKLKTEKREVLAAGDFE